MASDPHGLLGALGDAVEKARQDRQEPIPEERLAELEREHRQVLDLDPTHSAVRELVAEVRRLRELLDQQGDLPGDLAVARGDLERARARVAELEEELVGARSTIDRVRELHKPGPMHDDSGEFYCRHCHDDPGADPDQRYPCATVHTLDGGGE